MNPDVALAEAVGVETWKHGDDLCDCVFQRIGEWSNPYLGTVHQVRFCCAWARLREVWPDLFRDTFTGDQRAWNGEDDMPRALWVRQVAISMGITIPEARSLLKDREPPKGIRRPKAKRKWWQWR